MIVAELTERDRPAWDDYVKNSPQGMALQLSRWQDVLQKTYGYETPYLIAKDDAGGRVVGVLPMYIIRSRLVGRFATSMQGGLCTGDEAVAAALLERARSLARSAHLSHIVLQDTHQVWSGDLQSANHHVYWRVPLLEPEDEQWKRLDRNARRRVRRAREFGIRVEPHWDGTGVGQFYDVIAHFTHQVGTPVFPGKFIENVTEAFHDRLVIHLVHRNEDQKIIGAYLTLLMGSGAYGLWGATLHQYLHLSAPYLAHWEILRDLAGRGYAYWDIGRSPIDSQASIFKAQWGGMSHPVWQQVAAVSAGRPAESISGRVRRDEKFRLFTRVWSRLPFPVHQFLGPRLRRHIPFA